MEEGWDIEKDRSWNKEQCACVCEGKMNGGGLRKLTVLSLTLCFTVMFYAFLALLVNRSSAG